MEECSKYALIDSVVHVGKTGTAVRIDIVAKTGIVGEAAVDPVQDTATETMITNAKEAHVVVADKDHALDLHATARQSQSRTTTPCRIP